MVCTKSSLITLNHTSLHQTVTDIPACNLDGILRLSYLQITWNSDAFISKCYDFLTEVCFKESLVSFKKY